MEIVYSPRYRIDIGLHVFPTVKYQLVYTRLHAAGLVGPADVREPVPATWEELALVHTAEYLDRARTGAFSIGALAQLEVPWSPQLVEGFRLMCGGTIETARLALAGPPSAWRAVAHVGGGFHHAFADHGEGFCLFNDVAVAVRVLQREGLVRRAAILDLDVHHGNGTAAIFADDPAVFTCSVHQERNYPSLKPPGTLDLPLDDGTRDEEYLAIVGEALDEVLGWQPDLLVLLAGADPYQFDQLGGLALTAEGLRQRDRLVCERARASGVPLAVTLAGGYARDVNDTVAIHVATVEEVLRASG